MHVWMHVWLYVCMFVLMHVYVSTSRFGCVVRRSTLKAYFASGLGFGGLGVEGLGFWGSGFREGSGFRV